jgi:hypothetical protein
MSSANIVWPERAGERHSPSPRSPTTPAISSQFAKGLLVWGPRRQEQKRPTQLLLSFFFLLLILLFGPQRSSPSFRPDPRFLMAVARRDGQGWPSPKSFAPAGPFPGPPLDVNIAARLESLAESGAEGLFPIHGDRVQLQQMVMNLLLNAVEAMGASQAGARELLISTEQDHKGVLVAVRSPGRASTRHICSAFSIPFTPRNRGAWGWDYRSAGRSSKLMADAYGSLFVSHTGLCFSLRFLPGRLDQRIVCFSNGFRMPAHHRQQCHARRAGSAPAYENHHKLGSRHDATCRFKLVERSVLLA